MIFEKINNLLGVNISVIEYILIMLLLVLICGTGILDFLINPKRVNRFDRFHHIASFIILCVGFMFFILL